MQKKVLKMIADAAKKTAQASSNSASFFGIYQPKEPKDLDKKLAKDCK